MSDDLKIYDYQKFEDDVTVDKNHSLQYVKRQSVNAEEIAFVVHITNNVIEKLAEFQGDNKQFYLRKRSKSISWGKVCNPSKARQ